MVVGMEGGLKLQTVMILTHTHTLVRAVAEV